MSKPTLSRKDIAMALGVHVNTIINNERRYGLDRARVDTRTRTVIYNRELAFSELRRRRFLA